MSLIVLKNFTCDFSIYIVHDEVKDKNFELELSWVGEGNKVENCLDGYFGRCKILAFLLNTCNTKRVTLVTFGNFKGSIVKVHKNFLQQL